eukprot:jgi/Tetstr1/430247/TSEL_020075.t1
MPATETRPPRNKSRAGFYEFSFSPPRRAACSGGVETLRCQEPPVQDRAVRSAVRSFPAARQPPAWRRLGARARRDGAAGVAACLGVEEFEAPSIEGSKECCCQLTPLATCRRFRQREVNSFLSRLFRQVASSPGMPGFHLSRFDLFHAHLFLDHSTREPGLLFHAQEYPAFDEDTFPYQLGFCQEGSPLAYNPQQMVLRNVLWWGGALHVLDLSPGSALHDGLLRPGDPGAAVFYTVDEELFGTRVVDISYFEALAGRRPEHRLCVC